MTFLAFYDGTTTHNLLNGNPYSLDLSGWSPGVATLSRDLFGGRPHYTDVMEKLPITVTGNNAADLIDNLNTLAGVIDQANRLDMGDDVNPVLFQISTTGNSAAYECLVLRGDGSQLAKLISKHSFMVQAGHFGGDSYQVKVELPIIRRGLWIATDSPDTENDPLLSAHIRGKMLPGTFNTTADDAGIIHPIDIRFYTTDFSNPNATSYADLSYGYLIVAAQSSDIQVYSVGNGFDYSTFHWSTESDTTAWNGSNVLDVDVNDAMMEFDLPSNDFENYHVFAKINLGGSGTATGYLHGENFVTTSSNLLPRLQGLKTKFALINQDSNPLVYYLGMHPMSGAGSIRITKDSSASVKIDSVMVVKDSTDLSIIKLDGFGQFDSDQQDIEIKSNILTGHYPTIEIDRNSTTVAYPFPDVFTDGYLGTRGETPAAIIYATNTIGNYTAGSDFFGQAGFEITRYRGRLIP